MYGSDGGAQGPGPGAANTSIKKKSFREQVAQLPLRGIMSVLTMVFVLCIVPAVVFNLLSLDPSPLHWLVAFYLLCLSPSLLCIDFQAGCWLVGWLVGHQHDIVVASTPCTGRGW